MQKIKVLVYVDVYQCDPDQQISVDALQDAAVDAVENAMRHAMRHATGVGFSHSLENEVSIIYTDAVLYEEESTAADDDDDATDSAKPDKKESCEFCRHGSHEEPFVCPYCGEVWE